MTASIHLCSYGTAYVLEVPIIPDKIRALRDFTDRFWRIPIFKVGNTVESAHLLSTGIPLSLLDYGYRYCTAVGDRKLEREIIGCVQTTVDAAESVTVTPPRKREIQDATIWRRGYHGVM
jgi:hypothetical protein